MLSDIVLSYFTDRCTPTFVDLSYPPNAETFGMGERTTPYMMIKRPNRIANIFQQMDWISSAEFGLTLQNVSEWGEIVDFQELSTKFHQFIRLSVNSFQLRDKYVSRDGTHR